MCANLAILASLKLRFRINHSTHFAERQNHINGIENFWNQAKRHLRKFNGIPKAHFELYLKECEWRFNNSEIKFLFHLKTISKTEFILVI